MQTVLDQVSQLLSGYIPTLLAALAIFILGWLVAFAASALVRTALRRTDLDARMTKWIMGAEATRRLGVVDWIARGVYYLLLIFVLVVFLQALNLTIATEPLNRLLTRLFEFAPRLLGGGLLLLTAWVVAAALRQVVSRVLEAAKLDDRLGGRVGIEGEKLPPLSRTLANTVYWLVFLLFLPAVLGALALQGLLEPVKGLADQILGFLPNLFAAGLILAIGWLIARIMQQIVTNLLVAVGADRLADRLGIAPAFGSRRLSGLVGLIVYILILIPVVVTSLNTLQLQAITAPATQMLARVMEAIPPLFAAFLLLTVAYVVGRFLAELTTKLLTGAGFNTLLARIGLTKERTRADQTPAAIGGYLILVGVMLFAAIEASRLLGFDVLAELVARFTLLAGQVILGLIVFGVGLYLANLAAETVQASSASQASLLSAAARMSIIVLAGAIALRQMGLANEIISLAFGIVAGAVAVAVALAFGLGGRDLAAKKLQRWLESMEKKS